MLDRLSQFPALRILLLCSIGFFLSSVYLLNINLVFYVSIFSLIIGLVLFIFKKYFLSLLIFCFSIGLWFSYETENIRLKTPQKVVGEFPAIFEGEITEVLKIDSNFARIVIKGSIDTKFLSEIKRNSILLTIFGQKIRDFQLASGQKISAKIKARIPNKSILKEDFDESLYCASLGTQWVGRAKIEDVSLIDISNETEYLIKMKELIKEKISLLYENNSRAVMNAMLLGDKSMISSELRETFSLSGTAHLLAVSGLHVGIIAFIIFFLLSFIRIKWLKFFIFTIVIIVYVLISGLQESAIRAGLMSIIIVYLTTIERQIYPLNVAAFVFIILLIIKPELIFSPGFQMSFASIGGIILLFRPTKNLFKVFFKTENSFFDKIFSSFALTISASVTVSPIVAYYFGVYSIVSPIANLFVVPLMSLALIFGIISIFISFVSFQIADIYSISADFLLKASEEINKFSISLPLAYWKDVENIWIIMIISAIIFYLILSKTRKQIFFRFGVSVLALLMFYYILTPIDKFKIISRDKIVAVISNDKTDKMLLLIIDRKPHQTYYYDAGIIKLIKSTDKDIILCYNGLAGSSLIDKVKKIKDIRTIELDNQNVRLIGQKLELQDYIPKIITNKL